VQTPEPIFPETDSGFAEPGQAPVPRVGRGVFAWGERLALFSGLVLAVSAFTDWYSGSFADGLTLAVTGWNTGALGKLVFWIGLVALVLVALREIVGVELPATVPESLVLVALGALATIFVLIRLISIPSTFYPAGRGIGIWISLLAALAMIASGLLRAAEEL
jgi:hypothetical protein